MYDKVCRAFLCLAKFLEFFSTSHLLSTSGRVCQLFTPHSFSLDLASDQASMGCALWDTLSSPSFILRSATVLPSTWSPIKKRKLRCRLRSCLPGYWRRHINLSCWFVNSSPSLSLPLAFPLSLYRLSPAPLGCILTPHRESQFLFVLLLCLFAASNDCRFFRFSSSSSFFNPNSLMTALSKCLCVFHL